MCRNRKTRDVNEVEQEADQDRTGKNSIDSVSINSIQFNKNHFLLTTNLKMSADQNSIMVPYKVDYATAHIQKIFPKVTNEQLATTKNKNILLKVYNRATITQLRTCTVEVEHKND